MKQFGQGRDSSVSFLRSGLDGPSGIVDEHGLNVVPVRARGAVGWIRIQVDFSCRHYRPRVRIGVCDLGVGVAHIPYSWVGIGAVVIGTSLGVWHEPDLRITVLLVASVDRIFVGDTHSIGCVILTVRMRSHVPDLLYFVAGGLSFEGGWLVLDGSSGIAIVRNVLGAWS